MCPSNHSGDSREPAATESQIPLAGLWLPADWHEVTVLVAVSGGADSVALVRSLAALQTAEGRLVAAHFHHGLRGEAADADAAFVARLAGELGLPLETGKADPTRLAPATSAGSGMEEAARNARYEFLKAAAGRHGARYVATAHTADDQAETVLHRIVRGTGLAGLSGMRRSRPLMHGVSLIRPLLGVRRAELLEYLHRLGQPFCDDATNRDLGFTRNRLRHDLLPRLAADYNAQVLDALLRLSRLAGEAQAVIATVVDGFMPRCVQAEPNRIVIDCGLLTSLPRYLVRELLVAAWRRQSWPEQAMGFAQWDELAGLTLTKGSAEPPPGTTLPGGVRAWREGEILVIVRSTAALRP